MRPCSDWALLDKSFITFSHRLLQHPEWLILSQASLTGGTYPLALLFLASSSTLQGRIQLLEKPDLSLGHSETTHVCSPACSSQLFHGRQACIPCPDKLRMEAATDSATFPRLHRQSTSSATGISFFVFFFRQGSSLPDHHPTRNT